LRREFSHLLVAGLKTGRDGHHHPSLDVACCVIIGRNHRPVLSRDGDCTGSTLSKFAAAVRSK